MRSLLLILPFGLFCLSVSGRAYRLIEDQLSWTEAQSYCRAQYLDLATVDDQEQLNLLINVTQRNPPLGHVWTGLYDDMDSWRWSLQKEGYYDGGLDQFRLWDVGQPDNRSNEFTCGVMLTNGKWKTGPWTSERPFVCYSESVSPKFIYYRTLLTWRDAQSYCRQHHTDLVSIRNQVENDQVFALMSGPSVYTHIGLYRDGWKWSDGSPVSFTKFNDRTGVPCVALFGTGMETKDCATPCPFVCNDYPVIQVVKVNVKKKLSLNLEAVTESMLEQLKLILMKNGLKGKLRLTWRKLTDGNVFHHREHTN